jgi:hypothetical protein
MQWQRGRGVQLLSFPTGFLGAEATRNVAPKLLPVAERNSHVPASGGMQIA